MLKYKLISAKFEPKFNVQNACPVATGWKVQRRVMQSEEITFYNIPLNSGMTAVVCVLLA